MRLTSLSRKFTFLAFVLLWVLPCGFLHAGKSEPTSKGFTIRPSSDWIELPLPFQGVVVSYGRKGTLATFHITERDLDQVKTIEQLKWEDLFSPEFESIDIRTQSVTVLGGEKAKFCVYVLKPGKFKSTMEGKLAGKYINYVLIHRGKLFSITFKDTEDSFASTYPSFLTAIRTLRFDESTTHLPRKLT